MRIRTACALSGILIATLAACTGGSGDQASTSLPPKPTPTSAAPTATTPTTPASQLTEANAIALAKRTNAAINTLYTTQDPRPLQEFRQYSRSTKLLIAAFAKRKAQGYHFSGGEITATGPAQWSGLRRQSNTTFGYVKIPVSIDAFRVTDSEGHAYNSSSDPAGGGPDHPRGTFTLDLEDIGGHWAVTEFRYTFEA